MTYVPSTPLGQTLRAAERNLHTYCAARQHAWGEPQPASNPELVLFICTSCSARVLRPRKPA